jgi:Tol biopolymer transport system component
MNRLGRRDAPSWTRSGNWIVYMDDKDDGHQILSSDLWAVTPDGKSAVQLTTTDRILEMYPQCSPTENKIVCSTMGGEIYLLSYEER